MSSATPSLRTKIVRQIERPRPLLEHSMSMSASGSAAANSEGSFPVRKKLTSSHVINGAESGLELLDRVVASLDQGKTKKTLGQEVPDLVVGLNLGLKEHGPALEVDQYKDQFDKAMMSIRNACKDDRLDLVSRLHLLEVIELRAMEWKANDNVTNYYRQKLAQIELKTNPEAYTMSPSQQSTTSTHPGPGGDMQRSSSLNANASEFNPTAVAMLAAAGGGGKGGSGGKLNQKAEVLIRNADSGRDADRSTDFFQFSVRVGKETLELSGANLELVKTAGIALDEFFSANAGPHADPATFRENNQPNNNIKANVPTTAPPHATSEVSNNNNNKGGRMPVTVVRQPLFPSSPKEAFAEAAARSNTEVNSRRTQFAKTAKETKKRQLQEEKDLATNNETSAPLPLMSIPTSAPNTATSSGIIIPTAPTHTYSRDTLLGMANDALCRSPPASMAAILDELPGLGRLPSSSCPAPNFSAKVGDWDALFGVNGSVTAIMIATNQMSGSEHNDVNKVQAKKKNFLEVLRPHAPVRTWNEELGEWIEGGGGMATRA